MRSFLPVRGKARQAGHPAPRAHTSHRCDWRDASEHTRMRLHVCTLRTHSHTHFNAHPLMRTHMFTLMHTVAVHTHRHSGTRASTHSTDSCTITCSHIDSLRHTHTLVSPCMHTCIHTHQSLGTHTISHARSVTHVLTHTCRHVLQHACSHTGFSPGR